jgi:hypothetical protein
MSTATLQAPTAQHALRQGKQLAQNIAAELKGQPAEPFKFKTLGVLAGLGRRSAVAEILGFQFSGFIAWWLFRTIYLMKLPGFERKLRVAIDWTLDLLFPRDIVYLRPLHTARGAGAVSHELAAHVETYSRESHASTRLAPTSTRLNPGWLSERSFPHEHSEHHAELSSAASNHR